MKYKLHISDFILLVFAATLVFLPYMAMAQVAPQTPANVFTGKDAAAVITDALIKAGAGEDLQVSIAQAKDDDVIAQTDSFITGDVNNIQFDKIHSHWQATLLLKSDGKELSPVKLSGHYDEMVSVPVLKRRIQSGEVITQDDIDWSKEPMSQIRKNTVTKADELIGKSPKHVVAQGHPIRIDEIAGASLINRGAQVTLIFHSGNIDIKTLGQALDTGAKGDVIRVRNVASKAVVQGTVESSDNVRVTSPNSNSAEAM